MPNYQPGWEGARLAYKSGVSYIPVACITSRSESNATNYNEKVNVCTEGKVVRKPTSISRTVSVSGEVIDAGSLNELRALQDSKSEQTFRIYDSSGTAKYFKANVMNLNGDYPTGEGETATFTMDLELTSEYQSTDVFA